MASGVSKQVSQGVEGRGYSTSQAGRMEGFPFSFKSPRSVEATHGWFWGSRGQKESQKPTTRISEVWCYSGEQTNETRRAYLRDQGQTSRCEHIDNSSGERIRTDRHHYRSGAQLQSVCWKYLRKTGLSLTRGGATRGGGVLGVNNPD